MAAPSIAFGVGFARIGCSMAGCCFGAECSADSVLGIPLSWFDEQSSIAGSSQFQEHFVKNDADTIYVYPTQWMSAINGFIAGSFIISNLLLQR